MKFVIHNDSKKDTIVMIPPGGLDERAFAGALPYLADYRIVIPVLDGNVIGENGNSDCLTEQHLHWKFL